MLTTAKSESLSLAAKPQTPSSGLNAYTQCVSGAVTTNIVRSASIPATLHGAQNMSHAKRASSVLCVSLLIKTCW